MSAEMAMGWRRIISIEFMGFLFLILASFSCIFAGSGAEEVECWYILQVNTSSIPTSGTKDHVRVRIGDMNGTNVTVHPLSQPIEGNKEQPFRKGKTAKFNISGPCLKGEVCTLQFQVQGDDKWLVREARVQTQDDDDAYIFPFNGIFPQKTWHGFTCGENQQLPSNQQNKRVRKQSCRKRKLLGTKPKPGKSGC